MAQGTLFFQPIQRVLTSTAAPVAVAGARAFFYLAGTTTATPVYSDVGLTTPITQPVVADANGIFVEIFLTPGVAYKVDITTSAGVSLTGYPADNQLAIPISSSVTAFNGTAGETLAAGIGVYLSDGSGGKNAGQWYKWDSANTYSSTICEIGMCPAAIASGVSGTIQQSGQLTGLSALGVGTAYYVGTAGALTATAPLNARFVGHADSATSIILPDSNPRLPAIIANNTIVQGRLTATTALPVTLANVSGATSIFFTPYRGNQIALYDGTVWNVRTFTEITISLVGLTASKPYDIFAYDNAGTVTIETLVWTNTTTRATALVLQDGVLSKTGVLTRRYLGTVYINASGGQTDDTFLKRYLFNYYNRQDRALKVFESTASWTYTTATYRQANAAAGNQVEAIIGWTEDPIRLRAVAHSANDTGNVVMLTAIGEDSTSTASTNAIIGGHLSVVAAPADIVGTYSELVVLPAVGYHFYAWLEKSTAVGVTTWYGTGQGVQSGMVGSVQA